jgi:hypothetical protein
MLKITQQANKLRLRWRFEYAQKPSKYGIWDYTGQDEENAAWRLSREGLLYAIIEGKSPEGIIIPVIECPSSEFCNFQWEMEATLGGKSISHKVIGLSLVSRSHKYTVFSNGQVDVKERNTSDSDNNYEYGKV